MSVSNAVLHVHVPRPGDLALHTALLFDRLVAVDVEPANVAVHARAILSALTQQLSIPEIDEVVVLGSRPSNREGELHGLYERLTIRGRTRTRATVWMRTACRGQVVAPRTFGRTLLHELTHHLDYEFLDLGSSWHTDGFYARESDLVRQILPKSSDAEHGQCQLAFAL